MKYIFLFLSLIFLFSCDNQPPKDYYTEKSSNSVKIDTNSSKAINKAPKKAVSYTHLRAHET